VNPEHSPTGFHIDYGTTTAYGSAAPSPPALDLDAGGSSTDTAVVANLDGLLPGTVYHFRVAATNAAGIQHGADGMFITAPAAAARVTELTTTRATLAGTIDPHGVPSSYHFEYGPSASYGSSTPEITAGSGDGEQDVTQAIIGLSPSQTYHVRVVVTSSNDVIRSGADGTFRMPPAPRATVGAPVGVALEGSIGVATLVGAADTHGLAGSYRFELASLDSAYAITTAERSVPGDVVAAQHLSAVVAGLPLNERFRVRLIVSSNESTGYSDQITFASPPPPTAYPSPPPGDVYGCVEPRLDAYNHQPKPGEMITVTGAGLGSGGSVMLGDRTLAPTAWSPSGFGLQIPAEVKGTLTLTVNCGTVSNTIAMAIYHQPDNTFTITKHTAGAVVGLSVKVPGPGKIQTTAARTITATTTITKPGITVIKLRLSQTGIKAINKTKRLRVAVRVRYTPAGGQAKTKTITVTFKAQAGS
jgi:hypothetical protein